MAIRQRDFNKKYRNQTDAYKAKFSKPEFQGQLAQNQRRMAGDKLAEEQGLDSRSDLTKEQKKGLFADNPVSYSGKSGTQFYQANADGQRQLTDITDDNNPFAKLEGDGSNYGRNAAGGRAVLGSAEARRYLKAGHSAADVLAHFQSQDTKIGNRAQAFLDKRIAQATSDGGGDDGGNTDGGDTGGGDNGSDGSGNTNTGGDNNEGTQAVGDGATATTNTATATGGDGGDVNQQKKFNENTYGNFTDSTVYGNVNQGNDYSVNFGGDGGNATANAGTGGGSNTTASVDDGRSDTLSNLEAAVAATALNENQYEKSQSKLSGTGTAAKYSALADDLTGSSDLVKGLDASVEQTRDDYYNQTLKYMTGIFGDYMSPNYKVPVWKGPAAPGPIDDDDED